MQRYLSYCRLRLPLSLMLLATILATSLLASSPSPAQAAPLPPASWYAVVWNTTDDTLHWVNANGEQVSIARPKLDNEGKSDQGWVHISRDGKSLVVAARLQDNREAVGFYDLTTGQFLQQQVAAVGETIPPVSRYGSSLNSDRIAISFYDPVTYGWRVVNSTMQGNFLSQVKSTDPTAPPTQPGLYPSVLFYDVDEGLGQAVVHFQMRLWNTAPTLTYAAYQWYPDWNENLPVSPVLTSPYTSHATDILPLTRQVTYSRIEGSPGQAEVPVIEPVANAIVTQTVPAAAETRVQENNALLRQARWLAGGQWVGFSRQAGAFAPHWAISTQPGDIRPLGPNFTDLAGVPDGFLAIDALNGRIEHATSADFEAFAATVGTVVLQADPNDSLSVVYVSFQFPPFQLTDIATGDVGIVGGVDVQAPTTFTCAGAPTTRLAVGMSGMVSFTNGAPLNTRDAAAGNLITQIQEGTAFTVLAGPQCVDGYVWYQLNFANGMTGWSAEGDNDGYFIEPTTVGGSGIGGPSDVAAPVTDCSNALPTRLDPPNVVGGAGGRVVAIDGQPATAFDGPNGNPIGSIPEGMTFTTMSDAVCSGGAYWYQVLAPNAVNGWVQEANSQTYFLEPASLTEPGNSGNSPSQGSPSDIVVAPAGDCSLAPTARVAVGNTVVTDTSGTLAMRIDLNSQIPDYQVPDNVQGTIVGGPQCKDGYRYWQISLTLNGQAVTGWLSEGTQANYFLLPPRAN